MRIYNKKGFISGVIMGGLGILNLIVLMANRADKPTDFLVSFLWLSSLLLLFGISAIMRSLSKRLAKEDRLTELDERNRLIELKSQSKSFRLTQIITFLLMLALIVMGKVSGDERFLTIGLGLAFAYSISMFAEIFTYTYYENRN